MNMREAFRKAGIDVPGEPDRRDEVATQTNPQNRVDTICENCGKTFEPRQAWYRRCDDCQRQQQGSSNRTGRGRSNLQGRVGQSGSGHRTRNRTPIELPEFPDSYFENDAQGNPCLKIDFVSKEKVDPLAEYLANAKLTTSQLRNFFGYCHNIERLLKTGESWEKVAARFQSLRFRVEYARSNDKIPGDFQKFIDRNVIRVTSADDPKSAFLNGFLLHFEALVAFSAAYK